MPKSLACKSIKRTWDPDTVGVGYDPKYGIDDEGKPMVQFIGALSDKTSMLYVVREDGAVHAALYEPTGSAGCRWWTAGIGGNHYAWKHADEPSDEGWVGGVLEERAPSLLRHYEHKPKSTSSWSASGKFLVRGYNGVAAQPWEGGSFVIYDPSQDVQPQPVDRAHAVADTVFAEVGTLSNRGVMGWSLETGTQPLLRFYDGTRGAMNFRSDGKDMVWTYGEGKMPAAKTFATTSVMTAPHTTDPGTLAKSQHRVRADQGWSGENPYAVGCGHAARDVFDEAVHNGMFVVRLSDGVAWKLSGLPAATDYAWGKVLGVTCEEVFAVLVTSSHATIARIRLDSLGPGLPPD